MTNERATAAWGKDESGGVVVVLGGELDISSIEVVRPDVDEAVEAAAGGELVFELSQLEFMDSSGLALLISASQRVGVVTVRQPSATISRVIALTGLSDVIRIEE